MTALAAVAVTPWYVASVTGFWWVTVPLLAWKAVTR